MTVIGLDPGLHGAVVAIENGRVTYSVPTEELLMDAGEYSEAAMMDALRRTGARTIAIERQHPRPGEGASSTATLMEGYGLWRGLITGMGLVCVRVAAQRWQTGIVPHGHPPKPSYVAWCQRVHPELDLTPGRKRVPHDGLAAACGIADWCARNYDRG